MIDARDSLRNIASSGKSRVVQGMLQQAEGFVRWKAGSDVAGHAAPVIGTAMLHDKAKHVGEIGLSAQIRTCEVEMIALLSIPRRPFPRELFERDGRGTVHETRKHDRYFLTFSSEVAKPAAFGYQGHSDTVALNGGRILVTEAVFHGGKGVRDSIDAEGQMASRFPVDVKITFLRCLEPSFLFRSTPLSPRPPRVLQESHTRILKLYEIPSQHQRSRH